MQFNVDRLHEFLIDPRCVVYLDVKDRRTLPMSGKIVASNEIGVLLDMEEPASTTGDAYLFVPWSAVLVVTHE